MEMTPDQRADLLLAYVSRLLEHMTEVIRIHPDVSAGLVRVHVKLVENSFDQDFPEEFCAERIRVADLRIANCGGPLIGFVHDMTDGGQVNGH